MTTPNWKNGGSWEAIPTAACYGTHAGGWCVRYPEAGETAGDGTPCGAVGLPEIVIETAWLTDTGLDFWRDRFSSAVDTYANISLEAFNPRTGNLEKWAGKLHRPTFVSVGPGADAGTTIYRNVRIVVSDCATTA